MVGVVRVGGLRAGGPRMEAGWAGEGPTAGAAAGAAAIAVLSSLLTQKDAGARPRGEGHQTARAAAAGASSASVCAAPRAPG